MEILHDEFGIKRLDGDSAAAYRRFFLTTEKAARGEADGLEMEGCGEGDGLLASVGREERRAEPSAPWLSGPTSLAMFYG